MHAHAVPLASYKRVLGLALPIILTNLSQPVVGMTDTAVMGHLDAPHHLGAVSVGSTLFAFLFWGFGFLRMGTTSLTAQAAGRGDPREEAAVLVRAVVAGFALSVPLMLGAGLLIPFGVSIIGGSPAVQDGARTYAEIRIFAAPAALANYALLGWLLGQQQAKAALLHQTVVYTTNILLDLVLVVGLGFAEDGVAIASVLAEHAGLAMGLFLALRHLRRRGGHWDWSAARDLDAVRRLASLNVDLFIRTLLLLIALAWFTAQGARFGDSILAANAILMNLVTLSAFILDGFALSAEALVGAAVGRNNRRDFDHAVLASTVLALVLAALCSLAFFVAGGFVIDLLTAIPSVRATAAEFLPWAAVTPLIGVWCFQLDGIFIGAAWTRRLLLSMVIVVPCYLGVGEILSTIFGNHGVWAAMVFLMIARGVALSVLLPACRQRLAANHRAVAATSS